MIAGHTGEITGKFSRFFLAVGCTAPQIRWPHLVHLITTAESSSQNSTNPLLLSQRPRPLSPPIPPETSSRRKNSGQCDVRTELSQPHRSTICACRPPPPPCTGAGRATAAEASNVRDDLADILVNSCLLPLSGASDKSPRLGALEYALEVASQDDSWDRRKLYAVCNVNLDEVDGSYRALFSDTSSSGDH